MNSAAQEFNNGNINKAIYIYGEIIKQGHGEV